MPPEAGNPLLQAWDTPFGLPPFESIRPEHFVPAFEQARREHLAEIDAIARDPAPPDFENSVAALDRAGQRFHRLERLFHNLTASATSPALQEAERLLAPQLAAHANAIYLNRALFERLDALHTRRDELGLAPEQRRLLERLHLDFVRAGARLPEAQRARYAQLTERLAELQTRFGQNVLADEAGYVLALRGEAELAGLPDFVRAAARQAAADRGLPEGVHAITLSRSLIVPFLSFSERRDLREQAWRAWTTRGEHDGAHDNRPVAREILALRLALARAHGYATYADYALADSMAGSRAAVDRLLQQVWQRACDAVERERAALRALLLSRGEAADIEPWDWRRLAQQVRKLRFDLDETEVKPYFPLERMVEAAFDCARRLFGLQFTARPQLRAYHPDVQVYEVRDAAGASVGLFLHDNYARPGKRSGAWMSEFRMQTRNAVPGGAAVLPIVVNNNNFARGAAGGPTLLSFDDARTLFHEFGHGLHGLLSSVTYERLAGTNVLRDFVELPSQLFEHWLTEPAVLKAHARHVRTGEAIPDALVERLKAAHRFDQGYETVRYTVSALLDMAVHAHTEPDGPDITTFERSLLARIGAPPGVGLNHRLPHFQHLFSGDAYAAGYYVYLWAEVLDADGFDAFAEAGDPFDPAVAQRLRRYVYAAGDSIEPGAAYRAFRGRDAALEPMLRKRGLVDA